MGNVCHEILVFLLGVKMKRFAIIAVIAVALLACAWAGDHHDISFSFGQQTYKWPEKGISFSYGINIGLTERLELGIWGVSELVPMPFESNMLGLDLSFALLGARSTASKTAGSGLNMLLSVGGFYRTDNNGAGPMISITPLSIGTPVSGRRERILKTGFGYDFVNKDFVITFSLVSIDYYVRGTWRDYSFGESLSL